MSRPPGDSFNLGPSYVVRLMARARPALADSRRTRPARHGPRTVRGIRAPSLGRGTVSDRRRACQPDALLRMPGLRVVPRCTRRRDDRLLVGRGRGGLAAARDGDRRRAPARRSWPTICRPTSTQAPTATRPRGIVRAVRGRPRGGSRAIGVRTRRVAQQGRLRQAGTRGCPQSTAWRVQPSTHTFRLEAGRTLPLDTSGARAAGN
jgi:hypothetical protein